MAAMTPRIHVGVGGWTFEPWRDNFYPAGLPHSQELRYASRQLTAIEVNGTFYSTFKPATFAKWRDETPDGFVFSLKAHRFTTHRRDLATAGEGIQRFVGSGIDALGDKLGPLLWQFMPTMAFDAANVEAFLRLLPREVQGRPCATCWTCAIPALPARTTWSCSRAMAARRSTRIRRNSPRSRMRAARWPTCG
jgi:uncharacterized protein YecE (DUF72 family)